MIVFRNWYIQIWVVGVYMVQVHHEFSMLTIHTAAASDKEYR